MLEVLEDLGLTAYEARALSHLLRHGERTGPALSREADVPFGRVYDTLNGLVDRGLVTVSAGRPKRYEAAPVQTLPGRILAHNRRRLQEEEHRLEQQVDALGRELEQWQPRRDPQTASYGVRLGEDSARAFLIEATHEAAEQVVAYLAFGKIHDDDLALFDALRHAVGRGVRTRVLLRADDIDYLLSTPYVEDVLEALLPHLGENLEVRLTWADSTPFAALDRQRAMLGVTNPLDPDVYFAVIHVDDPVFSMGLEGKFEALWAEGKEPADLIQWALGKKGGRALLRFGNRLRARRGAPP